MGTPLSILDYRQPLEFHLGEVVTRSWTILSRHLLTFLGLVAVMEAIPLFITPKIAPALGRPGRLFDNALLTLATALITVIFSALSQSVVVFATFQDLRGAEIDARESLRVGLARVIPVIVTSVLMGLIVGFGVILLLIPGLIALAGFSVALPACVVERDGPIASLSRSFELTRGHWWPILGVSVSLFVVSAIVGFAIRAAIPSQGLPATILAWAWNVFFTSYSSVYAANLYHDLRAVKEGIGIEQIASVFD